HIELRRHTDNDGDVLSADGVRAAVAIGTALTDPYDLLVSSGAQRATQAAACFLAGLGAGVAGGVIVDTGFRSRQEDRWKAAYAETGSGHIADFLAAAPELVKAEARQFTEAIRRVAELIPDSGHALVVGHSPMHEATVYGLTGETIEPLGKGQAVVLGLEGDARARVVAID